MSSRLSGSVELWLLSRVSYLEWRGRASQAQTFVFPCTHCIRNTFTEDFNFQRFGDLVR